MAFSDSFDIIIYHKTRGLSRERKRALQNSQIVSELACLSPAGRQATGRPKPYSHVLKNMRIKNR